MLQIKNISKTYKTGELIQNALNDMSLNLRDNEFVSILGPSGSGKTTLLNIIGGLDKYDSGDMVINGISTKEYKDRDWDTYRNHTIGFVFQSYNLIPHQSILSNVEIALTIGGKSGAERRERAKKALEAVGLGDQLHKKPNQMSGGQMQRVAIARALVNDPAILLADEPTGALDTETGIQVMELLKEVAKDRLVVMVTHNPEIAEKYSTRIVKLRDGKIVDDSSPFEPEEETAEVKKSERLAGMSFRTSLALSFNNLKTKKGRTILTAFAGSIGIIGIALILALSNGVNEYIVSLQEDTMASYPVVIESSSFDMQALVDRRNNAVKEMISGEEEEAGEEREAVYADVSAIKEDVNAPRIMENDLTAFKKYLDDPSSEIHKYIGKNGIVYNYNIGFNAYSYDTDNTPIRSDARPDDSEGELPMAISGGPSAIISAATGRTNTAANFSEMLSAKDGNPSVVVKDNYDMVSGAWPSEYKKLAKFHNISVVKVCRRLIEQKYLGT